MLSKEDYMKEAKRQLNESVYYQKLPVDPTSQYMTEVKQCVDSMYMYRRELINKKVKNFLVPHHPREARFYLVPKTQNPGNPGRPIVASNGALTENISRFSDFFLQPSVTQIPSHIRDTTDFINKLRRLPPLPPGCLLVTLDISALYTNIPHEEGIAACEEFLNCQEKQEPPTTDVCQPIQLVLTKNSFIFNETNYLQVHGTAMGTGMAPSYANLFMGKLELEFLQTQDKIP